MPTNRLVFFLFLLVLLGSVLYLAYRPGGQTQGPVGLTPKEYIERVEAGRAARAPQEPATGR
jgi:hypothetical protein